MHIKHDREASTLSMQVFSKSSVHTYILISWRYAIWSKGGQWKVSLACMWKNLGHAVCAVLCGTRSVLAVSGGRFNWTLKTLTAYRPVMLFVLPRFSNSLWRSVLTSLIVRAASVTTTHCVAGVLWRTSVLEGPSARMQWSQWDGCRTPVSASQPQSLPASLSWITLRLWVRFNVYCKCFIIVVCFYVISYFIFTHYPMSVYHPTVECDSHSQIASAADKRELPVSVCRQRKTEGDHSWCWGGNS